MDPVITLDKEGVVGRAERQWRQGSAGPFEIGTMCERLVLYVEYLNAVCGIGNCDERRAVRIGCRDDRVPDVDGTKRPDWLVDPMQSEEPVHSPDNQTSSVR